MADHQVVIVGSGPAGLTAALYAARANLKPLLVDGLEAGGQLMLTTMVDNWPGFRDGIMGPDLMTEMRAQAARFGTEIVEGNVNSVDARHRPFRLVMSDSRAITTEALVIANRRLRALAGDRLRSQAGRARVCRPAPPAMATSSRSGLSRWWAEATRPWKRRST